MTDEPKIKTIREVLADKGLDPIGAMADLVKNLSDDKEIFKKDIEKVEDPYAKRDIISSGIELDKVKLRTLQAINDAKQREDDQILKITEQNLRKAELKQKEREKEEGPGTIIKEYSIPTYGRKMLPNGKIKMVKLEESDTEKEAKKSS